MCRYHAKARWIDRSAGDANPPAQRARFSWAAPALPGVRLRRLVLPSPERDDSPCVGRARHSVRAVVDVPTFAADRRLLALPELATLPPTGYPFACEKISASASPFAAFSCSAKPGPPDTIERPRSYSPAFREREIGAAQAGREHAGGFPIFPEGDCR